ncbi:protein of unknown function [Kyrpidia spormannii]|uniref:Uncharacterized protein n=1 Tax=Kyrpidia spormannii TaxID=2055160 RepID=A0A6F9EGI5_9BACL|nr:protein of unknown function [Kyrpidia spormannii]
MEHADERTIIGAVRSVPMRNGNRAKLLGEIGHLVNVRSVPMRNGNWAVNHIRWDHEPGS